MVYRENALSEPALVIAASGNHVVALDVVTGARAWTYDFFMGLLPPRVIVADRRVYALASELVLLDYPTGARVWRTEVPRECIGGVLLLAGDAVVIAGRGVVAGIDAKTGTLRWRADVHDAGVGRGVSLAIPGESVHGV